MSSVAATGAFDTAASVMAILRRVRDLALASGPLGASLPPIRHPREVNSGHYMKPTSTLLAVQLINAFNASAGIAPDAQGAYDNAQSLIASALRVILTDASVPQEHGERDRAIGCLAGLTVGDAVGAPLEFIDTDNSPVPPPRGAIRSYLSPQVVESKHRPGTKELVYVEPYNKFGLYHGQWTDDAAMSHCLADSLLVRRGYNGSDCRTRYYMWWFEGYNNAFRCEFNARRRSVGLGGNIAKSIDDVFDYHGRPWDCVPAEFAATGEDAGNGSMMRNAPVPIRYHADLDAGLEVAARQSYGTHPGPDAAACVQFMTYFCIKAIKRPVGDATPMRDFIERTIGDFKELAKSRRWLVPIQAGETRLVAPSGYEKLFQVLDCRPPSAAEHSWKWRSDKLPTVEAVHARGRKYNGYPVDAGYFGAYSMDGLSMALWGLSHSNTFISALLNVVNLLGDADTTGAIAGQMAGAFYGYKGSFALDDGASATPEAQMGQVVLRNLRTWDPFAEVELRALLLYDDGAQSSPSASTTHQAPTAAA